MRNPETISIGMRRSPAETVTHKLYPVASAQKFDLLHALLERTHYESVIVFCRMKIGADQVAARLLGEGHKVAVLHSDRAQKEREEALAGFRDGTLRSARRDGHRRARTGHCRGHARHQFRRAAASRGLRPPHRPHRSRAAGRRRDDACSRPKTCSTSRPSSGSSRGRSTAIKLEISRIYYTSLFELKPGENLEKIRVSGGRSGKGYSYSTGKKRR